MLSVTSGGAPLVRWKLVTPRRRGVNRLIASTGLMNLVPGRETGVPLGAEPKSRRRLRRSGRRRSPSAADRRTWRTRRDPAGHYPQVDHRQTAHFLPNNPRFADDQLGAPFSRGGGCGWRVARRPSGLLRSAIGSGRRPAGRGSPATDASSRLAAAVGWRWPPTSLDPC